MRRIDAILESCHAEFSSMEPQRRVGFPCVTVPAPPSVGLAIPTVESVSSHRRGFGVIARSLDALTPFEDHGKLNLSLVPSRRRVGVWCPTRRSRRGVFLRTSDT